MANVMATLKERGYISQVSYPELADKLADPVSLYAGFDPTADSLHIGNLMQVMLLAQFQRHGHRPIALIGGATAMIGDPSGKNEERNLLGPETIKRNIEGVKRELEYFLDFANKNNGAILVNNADWIGEFGFVEFLRDVGKHFRVGEMMNKESVRRRLQSEAGMSFTEFSYQLLQAYDFLHLNREYQCTLQVGGDDQWGNITAGIDLVRKLEGREVYGLTSPLLTTAGGQKFGKTEAGAVWLNPEKTKPYDFYQYWIRSDDRDVINLLKRFTFLSMEKIAELTEQVLAEPDKREAQSVLAREVTRLVHGSDQVHLAEQASRMLFGEKISGLTDKELRSIFSEVPSTDFARERIEKGICLLDVFCETRICKSRGEAKKLIKAGGAYVNNVRVDDIERMLTMDSLASETIMILRSGKKNYHLVSFS